MYNCPITYKFTFPSIYQDHTRSYLPHSTMKLPWHLLYKLSVQLDPALRVGEERRQTCQMVGGSVSI